MKFGLFYEHQLPQPWGEESELRLYQQALDQIELADRLGIDYVWEVEHHFLEEYSHSSAPEVFLAACSQRTKRIRLGHGITLMPPNYNHPARVAERIATLDLVSNGRVEWGTGESATAVEMGGFGVDPDDKRAMWEEATREAANMLAMRPYPGFQGRWFDMPCRNLVPKAVQRPHPPMWVACSRRETIHLAARNGLGALTFSFLDPDQAAKWVEEYYDIIKSEECVPIGHRVNPNIAIVTGMSCHPEEAEAIRRGLDGFRFFGYSLGYYALFGEHRPGTRRSLGALSAGQGPTAGQCRARRHRHPRPIARAFGPLREGRDRPGHVHPAERRQPPRAYLRVARGLCRQRVMPEFKERDAVREAEKRRELAPYIEAALARKPKMAPLDDAEIPRVEAFGRKAPSPLLNSDRGGAIPIPTQDPLAARESARP